MDKGTVAIALAGGALGLSLYNYVRGRRAVVTTGATGFYNGAQVKGGIVYASGQVAVCGKTADGKPMLKPGGVKAESRQCLENLAKILGDAGSGLDAVLKTTCYLGDISMYADFNEGARARAASRGGRACSRGGHNIGAFVTPLRLPASTSEKGGVMHPVLEPRDRFQS